MGQLLQILGRGIQVEAAELIWHWLSQAAETLSASEPAHSKLLNQIISVSSQEKPALFKQRIEEYRRLYPQSHYADLAAGACALDDNRLNDAYVLLKTVYSRCPRNVTALYALGHCCERLGKEADAIAFYQDCLKFKNYLQIPRQRLAAIYFKNGQIEKTIREYETLAEEYPDDLSTLLTLGYLYIAVNQHKRAADTFSTAILIQPDNFCPDTDPIDSLIEAGQFDIALGQIDDALTEFPDRPDLLLRRGAILAELDQPEEALEQYTQAVSVCPDFLEANIRLGSHYLRLGRPDCAALQFTRATYVNDRIVDAYLGIATAQKLTGNIEEALASLSMASAVETNGPILLSEAVRLKVQPEAAGVLNKQPLPSVAILNAHYRLLKLTPQNPELYYRLGCLLMCAGRLSQALELFSKVLELNPSFTSARNNLAVCFYETDEKALALETLMPTSSIEEEILRLHYKIALLYCDKVKFATSLLNLEQWLRETLTATDAALNISIVLQNLGLVDPVFATWDNLCKAADHPIS